MRGGGERSARRRSLAPLFVRILAFLPLHPRCSVPFHRTVRVAAARVAMKPPPPPSEMQRILREQDWRRVRVLLASIARRKGRSTDAAKELADAVIVACCDPEDTPWNPNEEPDLARHATYCMRDKLSAERRRDKVRRAPKNIATAVLLAPESPEPGMLLERAERRARDERILANASERLKEPFDRELLEHMRDGMQKPADQAKLTGRPIEVVRRARERIKYALRAAIEEEEASWKPASDLPKKS